MSEAVSKARSTESFDYHIFNTNRRHLSDGQSGAGVYGHGIVAAFADGDDDSQVEQFGREIAQLEAGDRVLSYENQCGVRAVGFVLESGTPEPVPEAQKLFHPPEDGHVEFHAPVHWQAVLPREHAVTPEEIKRVAGGPLFAGGTRKRLNEEAEAPHLLRDVVIGRSNRL
jgi:hypothetical protein